MSLVETINELCLSRLGREPNLANPKGFNDLIQWLKIHDQRREQVTACDKWAVRGMVGRKADCLIPAKLGFTLKWKPCVMKCTHDCGSVQFVKGRGDFIPAHEALTKSRARTYGADKGEWAYQFIRPRIVSEKLLEPRITDYKFHCSHGQIRWAQVIAERHSEAGPRETILAPHGQVLAMHMDQNMRHAPEASAYPGDEAWERLTALATKLAEGWRYVRVDLYWSAARAWFGELTFWPLAGCYLTPDEPAFGEMLQLDLSQRFEPIVT